MKLERSYALSVNSLLLVIFEEVFDQNLRVGLDFIFKGTVNAVFDRNFRGHMTKSV